MSDLTRQDMTDQEARLEEWKQLGKTSRRMNQSWCPSLLLPHEREAWVAGWVEEDKALRTGG